MDEVEARSILNAEMSQYRGKPYPDLLALVDNAQTVERISSSGRTYQIEMQVLVDEKSRGTLRVIGAVDDGTFWRAVLPLSADFIVAPDGSFIGE